MFIIAECKYHKTAEFKYSGNGLSAIIAKANNKLYDVWFTVLDKMLIMYKYVCYI